MKKALILLGVAAVVLLIGSSAFAASKTTNETGKDTWISAEGTANTLNYTDSSGWLLTTLEATKISVLVKGVYGFQNMTTLAKQSTKMGIPKTFVYPLTNEANAVDNFGIYATVAFTGTDGTGWSVLVSSDASTLKGTLTKLAPTGLYTTALGEDGETPLSYTVIPATNPVDAPNGSYCTVTFHVSTDALPVGEYLGANMNFYGGVADFTDSQITTIETAVMKMTRVHVVDAPINYTGNKDDAVPGSVISYIIRATNEGASDAVNVIIVDKVPTDTKAFHLNSGARTIGNVTLETPSTTETLWTVKYTTNDAANLGYGVSAGWFPMPADQLITNESGIGVVKYVKFEKSGVAINEKATLTWGVTIK